MLGLRLATFLSLTLVVSGLEELSPGKQSSSSQISLRSYITCSSTWSCENCYVQKLCTQPGPWMVNIWYTQCPAWSPYCQMASSGVATCTNDAPQGCKGP